jgi:hypothetical protein
MSNSKVRNTDAVEANTLRGQTKPRIKFYPKSGLYAKRVWRKSQWGATKDGPWHNSMIDARNDKKEQNPKRMSNEH